MDPTAKSSTRFKKANRKSPQKLQPVRLQPLLPKASNDAVNINADEGPQVPQRELSISEVRRLEQCETVILGGWKTFLEVGRALVEIRDAHLYRREYRTFEEYCRHRWEYSRAHAYRLIDAASVATALGSIGAKVSSEAQLRPLSSLSPREIPVAWKAAEALAGGGEVTGKIVRQVVEKIRSAIGDTREEKNEKKAKLKKNRPEIAESIDLVEKLKEAAERYDMASVLILATQLHTLLQKLADAESRK